jgi:hypothetical protein
LVSLKSNTANPVKNWLDNTRSSHLVRFYDYESQLITSLSDFIAQGLGGGEICIVIATRRHLDRLDQQLYTKGIRTVLSHQYVKLDAQEVLDSFMVGELPNWDKFIEAVEPLFIKAAREGKQVRAFGEMVALLWQTGNTDAVLRLEQFWNKLAAKYEFYLYCAYPMVHFDSNVHAREVDQICRLHTHCSSVFGKNLQAKRPGYAGS